MLINPPHIHIQAHAHIHTCAHTQAHTYTHTHSHIHTHSLTHTHTDMPAHTHAGTYTHTTHTHMHSCMQILGIDMYGYIYIYVYSTHICTHIWLCITYTIMLLSNYTVMFRRAAGFLLTEIRCCHNIESLSS